MSDAIDINKNAGVPAARRSLLRQLMAVRPIDAVPSGKSRLKQVLSARALIAIGLGATIGSGIFVLTGTVAEGIGLLDGICAWARLVHIAVSHAECGPRHREIGIEFDRPLKKWNGRSVSLFVLYFGGYAVVLEGLERRCRYLKRNIKLLHGR